jgi:DNA polymerase IV (DinB-like DNA polymerase)
MCRSLRERLQGQGSLSFRAVALIVRFSDFKTVSRMHTLPEAAASGDILEFEALKLLMPFLDSRENPKRKLIRLIGVRIEKLDTAVQACPDADVGRGFTPVIHSKSA